MIWRRRMHRVRLWLQALFASLVILIAVVIGVTDRGGPRLERDRPPGGVMEHPI